MSFTFKVVDLFAGPGGLAEGFSRFENRSGENPFTIALSIEKEAAAFRTLRLRSFARQFGKSLPDAYYRYLAREISRDDLTRGLPQQWEAACKETLQLELGAVGSNEVLDPRLEAIRNAGDSETILIGGPPCQAYSLVGRARNRGNADYVAADDHRHYLYEEYIRIIGKLRPAAFVMENVKGILSARVDGGSIFTRVLEDLSAAGGTVGSYCLVPLVAPEDYRGSAHVIETERFGIPQCRHRVILFGVRRDLADRIDAIGVDLRLQPTSSSITVADAIQAMPALRSGISRDADGDGAEQWRNAVSEAFGEAAEAAFAEEDEKLDQVASKLTSYVEALKQRDAIPPRGSTSPAGVRDNSLAAWLVDPVLKSLPNHEARAHMKGDLARYAFAAVFAEEFDRSPKANEYPSGLAPAHRNWMSGKFADRFRVQRWNAPSTTVTSHISKDGHYFIHPDPMQCRSLTVREAARLQTFPDNYLFEGNRTEQFIQVGNAVPPLLASKIAGVVYSMLTAVLDKPAN